MTSLITEVCSILKISPDAAKVYDTLINNPKLGISQIANVTSLSRQKVYVSLNELEILELLSKNSDKKYTKDFVVKSPTYLLAKLKAQNAKSNSLEKELRDNLIWINTPFSNQKSNHFHMIKDRHTLVALFIEQYSIPAQEILFFGSTEKFANLLGIEIINFVIDIRKKNNTRHRVISSDRLLETLPNEEYIRQLKYLTDNSKFNDWMAYSVFKDTVIFWNLVNYSCYVIKDLSLVEIMTFQFDSIWDTL